MHIGCDPRPLFFDGLLSLERYPLYFQSSQKIAADRPSDSRSQNDHHKDSEPSRLPPGWKNVKCIGGRLVRVDPGQEPRFYMQHIVPGRKIDEVNCRLIRWRTPPRVTASFQQITEAGLAFILETGYTYIKRNCILVIPKGQWTARHIRDGLVADEDLREQQLWP